MTQRTYTIGNMDCANCAREVEDGVRRLDGVSGVRVDFASAQMTLTGDVSEEILRRRVEALGKTLGAPPAASRGGVLGFWDYLLQRWDTRLALFGGAGILLTLLL
jgi:Zn2+/Cd2+-exporting ATPase